MLKISLYQQALENEREGKYERAFNLFHNCLSREGYDRGDLLFHCGWCLEQKKDRDKRQALSYYREAGETAENLTCKMNSFFRAGWLLMQEKDYAGATGYYQKTIQLGNEAGISDDIYQNALYWAAVCLEAQGQYLKALNYHRLLQKISSFLYPESRFREINCLNRVGSFSQALEICKSFEIPPPQGFDTDRYRELQLLANKERQILETCLSDEFLLIRETMK